VRLTYIFEETQHLIVCSVIGNEKSEVRIIQNCSHSDETRTSSRDDADILPCVLALFALTMVDIVEVGNRLTEGLNTSGGTCEPSMLDYISISQNMSIRQN
jgi:hypothetical protein